MHICIYVSIYIYLYLSISIYICLYLSIFIYIYLDLSIFLSIYVQIPLCNHDNVAYDSSHVVQYIWYTLTAPRRLKA